MERSHRGPPKKVKPRRNLERIRILTFSRSQSVRKLHVRAKTLAGSAFSYDATFRQMVADVRATW